MKAGPQRRILYPRILTVAGMLACAPATAQEAHRPALWGLCGPDELATAVTLDTGAGADAPVNLSAENALATSLETLLQGDVEVAQGDRRLQASQVTLDRETNRIRAEGGVIYGDPNVAVRSARAEVDLKSGLGSFVDAEYYVPSHNGQGSAALVAVRQREQTGHLERVTYSTCERGSEAWQLRSREMNVDYEAGRAEAWHVTLAMRDVPVFYFPYLSFPIDDRRQSGFLSPVIGYDDDGGLELGVPYYWNIAPNRDLTFVPRIFSERGLMLGLEYRLLQPRHRGELDLEVLPADQVFDDHRTSVNIRHEARPDPRLHTDLLYEYVSDDDYIEDFGNNLDLASITHLERHLEASWNAGAWRAFARVQGFQILDDEIFGKDRPYDRLPQLVLDGAWQGGPGSLRYEFHGEAVRFDRDDVVTGTRLDLHPSIGLPMEWSAGFLRPRLSYRLTAYELDNTQAGADTSILRTAPVASLDGGLFFERPLGLGGEDFIQTLEPRLFYLYVPLRGQDGIPVFDTTEVDLSFPWLFLENRFTGADRLGDANQLTTAVTTRLVDPASGHERARLSIGQVQYFQDREVTLEGEPERAGRSELITEARVNLGGGLSAAGTLHWDSDADETRRTYLDLRYHPRPNRLINLAHRFAEDELENVDASAVWSVGDRWRLAGRWNYSLKEDVTLDALAGLEYGQCCWILRMAARQRRESPEDRDPKNSFHLELEFKGLGNVGTSIQRILEDSILGYQRIRYR